MPITVPGSTACIAAPSSGVGKDVTGSVGNEVAGRMGSGLRFFRATLLPILIGFPVAASSR